MSQAKATTRSPLMPLHQHPDLAIGIAALREITGSTAK